MKYFTLLFVILVIVLSFLSLFASGDLNSEAAIKLEAANKAVSDAAAGLTAADQAVSDAAAKKTAAEQAVSDAAAEQTAAQQTAEQVVSDLRANQEAHTSFPFKSIPEANKNNKDAKCYRIIGINDSNFTEAVNAGKKLVEFKPDTYVVANFSYSEEDWETDKPKFSKFFNEKYAITSPFVIEGCSDDTSVTYMGNSTEFIAFVGVTSDARSIFGSSLAVLSAAAIFSILAVI